MSVPQLIRVDPRYPGIWERLGGYLEDALAEGGDKDWGMDDIYQAICVNAVALFAFVKGDQVFGAGVSSERIYPRRKVLEILLMSCNQGHEDDWRQIFEQFKAMAKAAGFSTVSGTGRPGWARKLGAQERRVFEVEL